VFSMGDDTAPSVLAHQPRLLYSYVKQRFAQVTNPPIDHLRERLVMSLRTTLGPPAPLLRDGPEASRVLQLDSFLLFPSGLRDIHHVVALLGFGAQAICPRLALQSVAALPQPANQERFVKAIEDGTLKVLAKMGISTIDSYQGAQIFEIIGLHAAVVDTCFAGTPSPIGGATFSDLGEEVLTRHAAGFRQTAPSLTSPGFFKHHKTGTEFHATNPDVVDAL